MATQRIISPSPLSASAGTLISSPFQFAVSGEDNLRVRLWFRRFDGGVIPNVAIVSWRTVDNLGNITPAQTAFTPAQNNGTSSDNFIPLSSGFIQNLTVTFAPFGQFNGLLYVTVDLIRGLTSGNATTLGQLLAGYIRPGAGLAWPGSPIVSSTEGRGFQRVVQPALFTIGADLQIIQVSLSRWRLLAADITLTTDATAVQRLIHLEVCDSAGTLLLRSQCPSSVGPNTALRVAFLPGASVPLITGFFSATAPMPVELIRLGTQIVQTSTVNLAAGDQITEFNLFVEEWLEASI